MPTHDDDTVASVGLSGSLWADLAIRNVDAGAMNETDQLEYRQQTRGVFRVTPTIPLEDDWFVQGQAEFVGSSERVNESYSGVDDLWVRAGKWNLFDVQVGRMQGWEVYHYGMGLDLNTFERAGARVTTNILQPYGVSDLWDRAVDVGSVAVHVYPVEWARVELLGRMGVSSIGNDLGLRPVGILDFGFVKLKAGFERRTSFVVDKTSEARTETKGPGGSIQFVIHPWVEFGGGIAQRVKDDYNQQGGLNRGRSDTVVTYGGFVNGRVIPNLVVGLGYHHSSMENLNVDPAAGGSPDKQTHVQMFGAVQYTLWDKLAIKYVFSPANATITGRADAGVAPIEYENKSESHRLRFAMAF